MGHWASGEWGSWQVDPVIAKAGAGVKPEMAQTRQDLSAAFHVNRCGYNVMGKQKARHDGRAFQISKR